MNFSKLICLFKGHLWSGGYWYYVKDGLGLDRRFCRRCCNEWSVVD